MPHSVFEKVERWAMQGSSGPDLYEVFNQVEYLADKRFHEYHPTTGPHPDFRQRLRDWLNNTRDEGDQKILLQLVPFLFFIGLADFNSLYRAAFRGPIARWLIEKVPLSLIDQRLNEQLRDSV